MILVEKPCITRRGCRATSGMSQTEWANKLDVDQTTVSSWETGKTTPDARKMAQISELSGVPMALIILPEKS